jgi:hypothetical protein
MSVTAAVGAATILSSVEVAVLGNACAPAALFPNFTHAAPSAALATVSRDEVKLTV